MDRAAGRVARERLISLIAIAILIFVAFKLCGRDKPEDYEGFSPMISAVDYDEAEEDLTLLFQDGSLVLYSNVPEEVYFELFTDTIKIHLSIGLLLFICERSNLTIDNSIRLFQSAIA